MSEENPYVVRIGTPLRDAAVDPQPEDHQAPVNAGRPGPDGNPHSGHVVATQAVSPRSGMPPAVAPDGVPLVPADADADVVDG